MDWSLKAPAWDLTEFEQAAISNIHAVQGSSSLGDNKIRGDFSIDLKLGRVGSYKLTENLVDKGKGAQLASGSSKNKRARAAGNVTQMVSCLVDGCISDLSNCREYHRRHKVCEQHSKTPQVTIRGHKQRFCQQCSRFHSLEEFDEGKRSCRKRLDGHNRRRRKPQPEAISRGSFLSNYQGSQMLSFSNTQVYPSTTVSVINGNTAWSGADEEARLYKQHQQVNKQSSFLGTSSLSSSSRYYYKEGGGEDKQLQGHGLTLNDLSTCQPPRNIFCDTNNAVPYEDCALSLLSSPQLQTSGLSLDSSGRDAQIHYPANFQLPSQTLAFRWDH